MFSNLRSNLLAQFGGYSAKAPSDEVLPLDKDRLEGVAGGVSLNVEMTPPSSTDAWRMDPHTQGAMNSWQTMREALLTVI